MCMLLLRWRRRSSLHSHRHLRRRLRLAEASPTCPPVDYAEGETQPAEPCPPTEGACAPHPHPHPPIPAWPPCLTTKARSAAHMTQNSSLSGLRSVAASSLSSARTSLAAGQCRPHGKARGGSKGAGSHTCVHGLRGHTQATRARCPSNAPPHQQQEGGAPAGSLGLSLATNAHQALRHDFHTPACTVNEAHSAGHACPHACMHANMQARLRME